MGTGEGIALKGGQKTVGAIYNEAFELMKAKYWQLVGSGSIVAVLSFLSSICIAVFFAIVYFVMFAMMGIGLPLLFIPFSGSYNGDFGYQTQAVSMASLGLVLVVLAACLVIYMGILLIAVAASIVEQTAGVSATEATLLIIKGDKPTFDSVFKSFKLNWKRYLGISAWSALWTFLWSLLLYVPGVIKGCSYMLAPALVVQYPDMTVRQALKKSMEITQGHKGKLFLILVIMVGFTLAGELVSCILPFGMWAAMLFWTYPLYLAMLSIAYLDIRQAAMENGLLPPPPG